ncbi:hypothetical protein BKA82DRAFT_17442 [Pisolithus tinctorius]|uniref:Uncharacterized protein n=1 Tax=Pisolithus tinctorius Marx 270 TaxID=870435 RepID=A0A0C3JZG0_PISTI|nr:hypothetical protein BKA82DRAFT_17442 [Pisolithus tinctorius]KIO14548.1 hypothetical protein M404DRAFT_17442 [Pisolithus tinctorius Marx 270]
MLAFAIYATTPYTTNILRSTRHCRRDPPSTLTEFESRLPGSQRMLVLCKPGSADCMTSNSGALSPDDLLAEQGTMVNQSARKCDTLRFRASTIISRSAVLMEASDYPRQRVLEPEKNRADRLSAERWEDMVYDRGPGPGSGDNARYRHGRKVLTNYYGVDAAPPSALEAFFSRSKARDDPTYLHDTGTADEQLQDVVSLIAKGQVSLGCSCAVNLEGILDSDRIIRRTLS